VAAALLADVISDTAVTAVQLEEHVPHAVVQTVLRVTHLSELSQTYRDNAHSLAAPAMLDMLTSMSDVGAMLIKLAGRLHNMRTIEALPRCKQVRGLGGVWLGGAWQQAHSGSQARSRKQARSLPAEWMADTPPPPCSCPAGAHGQRDTGRLCRPGQPPGRLDAAR
jgi:hypothetical protein